MQKLLKKHPLLTAVGSRLILGVLLLCIVGGVLAGCSQPAATNTLSQEPKNFDAFTDEEQAKHDLTAEEINKLTDLIYKDKNAATIRTQLVAALNGYDMTAKDFDDTKVGTDALPAQPDKAGAFAYNVLKKAFFDSTDEPENLNVQDSGKTMTVNLGEYKDMTAADVQSIVDAFKTEVAVESNRNFLDTILWGIGVAFRFMIKPMGFGSFILGSLYFAIAVELLMLPISILQQKNARKQAAMRPKEMAIRNKYAGRNDQATQQKVSAEIQELYQKEGYNPMTAGCLPLLISLPVIMALYQVVIDPLKYILGLSGGLSSALTTFATAPQAAGGLGHPAAQRGSIEVLARMNELPETLQNFQFFSNSATCYTKLNSVWNDVPDFSLGNLNFGLVPGFTKETAWLLIIPVLTFVVYFFSMKINRKLTYQPTVNADDKAAGCSNKIMDWSMPLLSVSVTFAIPAAVGLYWIFKSILGVVKQLIMSKVMPLPTFTDEDYKAAIKELQGKDKDKPKKKSGTRNPNVRSLHHIDDEDYESEAVKAAKAKVKAEEEKAKAAAKAEAPAADGADHPMIERAAMKEDRPAKKNKKEKKTEAADEAKDDAADSTEQDA